MHALVVVLALVPFGPGTALTKKHMRCVEKGAACAHEGGVQRQGVEGRARGKFVRVVLGTKINTGVVGCEVAVHVGMCCGVGARVQEIAHDGVALCVPCVHVMWSHMNIHRHGVVYTTYTGVTPNHASDGRHCAVIVAVVLIVAVVFPIA